MASLSAAKQRVRTVHWSAFLRQELEVTPYLHLQQDNELLSDECHHLASLSLSPIRHSLSYYRRACRSFPPPFILEGFATRARAHRWAVVVIGEWDNAIDVSHQ